MTTPTMTAITSVPPAEQERAIAPLVTAFAADPVIRWIYPEPQRYLAAFPEFVRILAGRAFEGGTAYSTEDFTATALWLGPGVTFDEEALGALLERTIDEDRHAFVLGWIVEVERYHPTEPHWYLPLIGVDVTRQGSGTGSRLLEHALARCDADHLPAYLESSNPRSIPLYQRFGFEAVATIQPDGAPPLWPMYRHAR